jgi:hypothetical protein
MLIGCIPRAVGHRQNHAGSDRSRELDNVIDFFFSRTHLLRTCEVGHRSRLTMERQDQRKVDQLLGLCVQRAIGVNLPEIGGEVFVGAEVGRSLG